MSADSVAGHIDKLQKSSRRSCRTAAGRSSLSTRATSSCTTARTASGEQWIRRCQQVSLRLSSFCDPDAGTHVANRRIELAANASESNPEALDHLEKACLPVTFGRNAEDVLDETYRKAGKLDTDSFALALDPVHAPGLLEAVRSGLFSDAQVLRDINAEPYKLNVYCAYHHMSLSPYDPSAAHLGKDAFFKSHKDTPRAVNMFGSLVVVFPTAHEGGTLVFRHAHKEWTFESGKILSEAKSPNTIAFAAFFSDVDHEITPVSSGHRVTVTYNLYFTPTGPSRLNLTNAHIDRPSAVNTSAISGVLAEILTNPSFLHSGGTLGFGLRHEYPWPRTWSGDDPNPLDELKWWLKGSDAALMHACTVLGLHPLLRLAYEDDGEEADRGVSHVLIDHPVDFLNDQIIRGEESQFKRMCNFYGAVRTDLQTIATRSVATKRSARDPKESDGGDDSDDDDDTMEWDAPTLVHMVTELTEWNTLKSGMLMYGNDSHVEFMYANVCLVVDVGPFGQREEVDARKWVSSKSVSD